MTGAARSLLHSLDARRTRPLVPDAVADVLAEHPIRAVDVGAARGIPPHWAPFIDVLRVDAFEPRRDECERLAAASHPHISWHPVGLAGVEGPRKLHVLATPTGSSLFPPNERFARLYGEPSYLDVVEVAEVACTTLAAQFERLGRAGPVLVKLDTQGTELEILSGLSPVQRDGLVAVEVETEFHTVYDGQPLFPEVHAHLVEAGFELFDLRTQRVHLTGGRRERHYLREHLGTAVGTWELSAKLHAADALYIRPFTDLAEHPTPVSLATYLTILQIYRFHDVIFWLLDQPAVREVLGVQGVFALQQAYAASVPRPRFTQRTGALPTFLRRGRRAMSYALERGLGVDGFDPPRTFWTHLFPPDQ
jgi:FkbM family methyltransferase